MIKQDSFYLNALSIQEKNYGKYYPKNIMLYEKLALLSVHLGNSEELDKWLEKCDEIFEHIPMLTNSNYYQVQLIVIRSLMSQENYVAIPEKCKQLLETLNKHRPDRHIIKTRIYYSLAVTYYYLENYKIVIKV